MITNENSINRLEIKVEDFFNCLKRQQKNKEVGNRRENLRKLEDWSRNYNTQTIGVLERKTDTNRERQISPD